MKYDVVLAGVGGQGVLSTAAIIAEAAMAAGLHIKQSEVHGMSQRGGSVAAHLRLSDRPIAADTVSLGTADLILASEPMEALRQVPFLALDGWVITATAMVTNIPSYPEPTDLMIALEQLPHLLRVDAESLAREAGSIRAANSVLLGAAAGLLPVSREDLAASLSRMFSHKGEHIVDANAAAFAAGIEAWTLSDADSAKSPVEIAADDADGENRRTGTYAF